MGSSKCPTTSMHLCLTRCWLCSSLENSPGHSLLAVDAGRVEAAVPADSGIAPRSREPALPLRRQLLGDRDQVCAGETPPSPAACRVRSLSDGNERNLALG